MKLLITKESKEDIKEIKRYTKILIERVDY